MLYLFCTMGLRPFYAIKFSFIIHVYVAEEINEDTIFTFHGPSVGPFIIPSNHTIPARLHACNSHKYI